MQVGITIVNLILCVVILAIGIWAFNRKKGDAPLYIGIAFGLFAVTHLLTLIGLASLLAIFIIIVRIIAYLLVIFAIYRILTKK